MVPGTDKDGRKDLVSGLESVQVRNYEFDSPGEYTDADLNAVRKQVASLQGCTKIVESKEKNEHSEIYMCNGGKVRGMAIISAEPKEISVVYIRGPFNMSDLGKLNGAFGTPKVDSDDPDEKPKKDKAGPAK